MNAAIRPIAICVFRHRGRILVAEGYDTVKGQAFYRPLGGGIEFGERGAETIRREIREEIGSGVEELRFLGLVENLFTYLGEPGHELVMVFDGRLSDESLYGKESFQGHEEGWGPIAVRWVPLEDDGSQPPLYPEGLRELLGAKG